MQRDILHRGQPFLVLGGRLSIFWCSRTGPNLNRQYLAIVYAIYRSAERTIASYLILSHLTLRNELYRLFYSGSPVSFLSTVI